MFHNTNDKDLKIRQKNKKPKKINGNYTDSCLGNNGSQKIPLECWQERTADLELYI